MASRYGPRGRVRVGTDGGGGRAGPRRRDGAGRDGVGDRGQRVVGGRALGGRRGRRERRRPGRRDPAGEHHPAHHLDRSGTGGGRAPPAAAPGVGGDRPGRGGRDGRRTGRLGRRRRRGPWTAQRRLVEPVDDRHGHDARAPPRGDPAGAGPHHASSRVPGGTSPSLRRLWLTADRAPAASPPPASNAVSARVYATRVGLVGNRTANGHRVVTDDRFVALPSRRGLAADGTGDYTAQVCTDAGRCAWAPVWDVGPWNTRDDYWSTPDTRETFGDLPRGVPEAQAAVLDGYAGGRDGSGRKVGNPAGIDLADGTFRDDLGLRDNAWVQVTYLWTGTGRSGTARTADPITVRARGRRRPRRRRRGSARAGPGAVRDPDQGPRRPHRGEPGPLAADRPRPLRPRRRPGGQRCPRVLNTPSPGAPDARCGGAGWPRPSRWVCCSGGSATLAATTPTSRRARRGPTASAPATTRGVLGRRARRRRR